MKIAARFLCHSVKKFKDQDHVELQPVYSSKDGTVNHEWSKYTPSGKLEMVITAAGAIGAFVPGKEYNVLFSPVEEHQPTAG